MKEYDLLGEGWQIHKDKQYQNQQSQHSRANRLIIVSWAGICSRWGQTIEVKYNYGRFAHKIETQIEGVGDGTNNSGNFFKTIWTLLECHLQ